ncbi:hypothetical protein H311_01070, partial [Anncaliia algerae PRA109]
KKIGGKDRIVEIDESKFSKRKYNIGRNIVSLWVVGGIDVESGDSFFVEVIKRDATTLRGIILENVEQGSILHTDCWRGYINLQDFGYKHYTVNHSQNFVNPSNFCSTQMIEGMWSVYKRKFRSRYITRRGDLTIYILLNLHLNENIKILPLKKLLKILKIQEIKSIFKFIKVFFDLKNIVF